MVARILWVLGILVWMAGAPGPASGEVRREPAADVAEKAVMVSGGRGHTCAVVEGGGVKCWGGNWSGQLGNGTTMDHSHIPVDVVGLSTSVAAVTTGNWHTCALTTGGGVKCWGQNTSGQLGNGTRANSNTPVDVVGLSSGVIAISAGSFHTCALTSAGGVTCWGRNDYGQLGNGMTTDSSTPVSVLGLSSAVTAIAAGSDYDSSHTCALTTGGGVKCWGTNWAGQLGDGTTVPRSAPVDVQGLAGDVAAIAAGGAHSCAVGRDGGVWCWGANSDGQLGDGTVTTRLAPVGVAGLASGMAAVTAGAWYTCAVSEGGGVKCWGDNRYGQLGDGTMESRRTPIDVVGLSSNVIAADAGLEHACAVTTGGGVKCWGNDYGGALGVGELDRRSTPSDVVWLDRGVSTISAGVTHTCAVTEGGGVKCWGRNDYGQLGDGTTIDRWTPVDVLGLSGGVVAVSAGGWHTCALTAAGGVKCWGANLSGQLGDGTESSHATPVDVVGLASGVAGVEAGIGHTCALTAAGGVKCWGRNEYGQLGDGTTIGRSTPVDVVGLADRVVAVSPGDNGTYAVTASGGITCWGPIPVDVAGLSSGMAAVDSGWIHACALATGGGVKCWGNNDYGQMGDGTSGGFVTDPVDVVGLASGTRMISAGEYHNCVLTASGSARCWGNNGRGQLGDGTFSHRSTPVDVAPMARELAVVSAGYDHTCALTVGGGVKCWGSNYWGQLGIGRGTVPLDVVGLGRFDYPTTRYLPYIGIRSAGR